MDSIDSSGYDAPVVQREKDDLDRWRFALNIAHTISDIPPEWSVRIGVYGKWGEGKTSVLKFLEKVVTKQGHLVVWFNPWSVHGEDDLWVKFADKLVRGIENANIKIGFPASWLVKGQQNKGKVKEVATSFAPLIPSLAKTVAGGGFAVLENFFSVDSKTVKNIRKKLGDRRIIVIIDDLDRADPKLIPTLLLSLRELLDLPGFSFILAFDNDIVAEALKEYHSAWGTGHEFLEKIIEFPFYLPVITKSQWRCLFDRELAAYAEFIPKAALDEVEDLLPLNPRKLKLFIRNLGVLKKEAERHGPEELDWISILIAQLIKIESELFLQSLLTDLLPKHLIGLSLLSSEENEEMGEIDRAISKLIEACKIEDKGKKERLRSLVRAWGIRSGLQSSEHFIYQASFASLPHAITWKEFRGVFDSWRQTKDAAGVNKWVVDHAKERDTNPIVVGEELFGATKAYRDQKLSEAADSTSREEQEDAMKEVSDALSLLRLLFCLGIESVKREYFATPSNFKEILKMADRWIHFKTNPADKKAREEERKTLLELTQTVLKNPEPFIEVIEPWTEQHDERVTKKALRDILMNVLEPIISEKAVSLFQKKGGVARLREEGKKLSYKYVLFRKSSLLYQAPLLNRFYQVTDLAGHDRIVHENCLDFFDLMMQAMDTGINTIPSEQAKELIGITGFIERLWKNVTAREFQFRSLDSFRKKREKLIAFGAQESILPIPGWMKAGKETR